MSGTGLIKTWPIIDKKNLVERLAKTLGWDGIGGEKGFLEVLERVEPDVLMKAEYELLTKKEIYQEHIMFPLTPVVEPYITPTTFIPKDPVLMARKAWSKDIDCMIGVTSFEGGLMFMFGDNYLTHF